METSDDLTVVEEALARLSILEDVGNGDVTAPVIPEYRLGIGIVRAKQHGVLSGLGVATQVFRVIDVNLEIESLKDPADHFAPGDLILKASGSARSLLTAERSVLNFLQHLSGIATLTSRFVKTVEPKSRTTRITDTRKTVPGLRLLEKEAVIHGGGVNHRLGLYDAVMIKDNHVVAAGGIENAVEAARAASPGVPIIVEARDMTEAEEAARLGVGRILLDNMTPDMVKTCVKSISEIAATLPPPAEGDDGRRWISGTYRDGDSVVQIEVSGGLSLETAAEYAFAGVDFLSIGELTHSAPAIDISMDLEI